MHFLMPTAARANCSFDCAASTCARPSRRALTNKAHHTTSSRHIRHGAMVAHHLLHRPTPPRPTHCMAGAGLRHKALRAALLALPARASARRRQHPAGTVRGSSPTAPACPAHPRPLVPAALRGLIAPGCTRPRPSCATAVRRRIRSRCLIPSPTARTAPCSGLHSTPPVHYASCGRARPGLHGSVVATRVSIY